MKIVRVPWLPGKRLAVTLSPFVLILGKYRDNKAILLHEQKHLDQIQEMGWTRWYWRYIFDRDFRRQQEAEGYAIQRAIEKGRA